MLEFLIGVGTLGFLLIGSSVAHRLGLIDLPNEKRKQHTSATPLIGGLAIFGAFFMGLLAIERPPKLDTLLFCLVLLVAVGVLDDRFHLPVRIRLFVQICCAIVMIVAGDVVITNLGPLFGDDIRVPDGLEVLITVLLSLLLMNAVNMSDGIDGNAAGHVILALLLISFGQLLYVGEVRRPEWLSALTLSIIIFWIVNMSATPIKKVFMGDAGSVPLGFVIGWLCIDFTQGPGRSIHPVMALWSLLIPTFDVLGVIILRIGSGRSPFEGDRLHLHHVIPAILDVSQRSALILMLSLSLSVGICGVWLTNLSPELGLLAYCICMCVGMSFHVWAGGLVQKRGWL